MTVAFITVLSSTTVAFSFIHNILLVLYPYTIIVIYSILIYNSFTIFQALRLIESRSEGLFFRSKHSHLMSNILTFEHLKNNLKHYSNVIQISNRKIILQSFVF